MERRDTFEIQVTFQSELLQLSKSIIIQYDARTKHQGREVSKGEEKVQCSMHFNKFLSSDSQERSCPPIERINDHLIRRFDGQQREEIWTDGLTH